MEIETKKNKKKKKNGHKFRQGAVNLSEEERLVIEKVVNKAGLGWFSYVERKYGDRLDSEAEHFYPFDRVLDKETGSLMSIRDALVRIEDEIDENDLGCLDEHERNVYAGLYERSSVGSRYVKVQYKGIFRNKGLFRRGVRWSAMDELADSFVNEDAKRLWNEEGFPVGVLDRGLVNIPNIKFFRENDKKNLTEEEFDRISEVFRRCINM